MDKKEKQREKFKNAILYFVRYCNTKDLGATKLNKLMYYLDFLHYRDFKVSVTGADYTNKDYGPVPDSINSIIVSLQKERKLKVDKKVLGGKNGVTKMEYTGIEKPNMSFFNDKEEKTLKGVCKKFKKYATDKIVAQTHLEAPWFYSKKGDKINFKYAQSIEVKL